MGIRSEVLGYIKGVMLMVIVLSMTGIGYAQSAPWQGPASPPPNGNLEPPIFTNGATQTRVGDLIINSQLDVNQGLVVNGLLASGYGIFASTASRLFGLYVPPGTTAIFDSPSHFYDTVGVGYGPLGTSVVDLHVRGDVGVGTQSPRLPLDVNGPVIFQDGSGGSNSVYIGNYASSPGISNFVIGRESGLAKIWQRAHTSALSIQSGNLSSSSRINMYGRNYPIATAVSPNAGQIHIVPYSGRNLGIGTTNPQVQTDINSSEVRMGNDGKLTIYPTPGYCCGTEAMALQTTIDNRTVAAGLPYAGENRHVIAMQPLHGRVGIGTTTPVQKLDVEGAIKIANTSTAADGTIRWTGTDFQGRANGIWVSLTGAGIVSSKWLDGSAAGDIYYSAGDVGVGTSNPLTPLHVNGKVKAGREGYVGSYNSSQVQGIWSIGESWGIDTGLNDFGNQYGIVYAHTNAGTTGTSKPIAGWAHQILFTQNGIRNAAISLSSGHGYFAGNLGVGTTAPAEKVDVSGAIRIGNTSTSNAGTIRWTGSDFEGRTGSAWVSLTGGGGTPPKWTDGLVAGDIYYNGQVGINTNDPQAELHVVGDAIITGNLDVDSLSVGGLGTTFDDVFTGWFTTPNFQLGPLNNGGTPSSGHIEFREIPNTIRVGSPCFAGHTQTHSANVSFDCDVEDLDPDGDTVYTRHVVIRWKHLYNNATITINSGTAYITIFNVPLTAANAL